MPVLNSRQMSVIPFFSLALLFLLFHSWNQDNHKLSYIQQLRPTQTVQPRIKLKLFGHSGAGKSTLLESLKCGILRSFFRRRRTTRITNAARHPNSPINSKPAGNW
ncbi:Death-associated protein kinase 1 [Goodea atripinnis]|uniref:Death-associated protein kinase 1 n=1 Tax=Goodea atripinnis TaxID=208336 RepID=A0ABV0MM39_9TELE